MKKGLMAGLMAGIAGMLGSDPEPQKYKAPDEPPKPREPKPKKTNNFDFEWKWLNWRVKRGHRHEKKCLQTGETHTHNNDFCSAEACKAYRNVRGDTIGTSRQRRYYREMEKYFKEIERDGNSNLSEEQKDWYRQKKGMSPHPAMEEYPNQP